MEKEQIIKALEWHSTGSVDDCKNCPYDRIELADDETCADRMCLDTLQLIKELTEENEKLQAEITHLEGHREADIKAFKTLKTGTVREIFKEIYSSLDYIEEQMEPEEIPECFFSVREDINALKERFERGGAADEI